MTNGMKIEKKDRWLTILFAVQPCLDVLAYFTRNDRVTPAGIIRLVLMVALPCYVFFRTTEKKRFALFLAVTGGFCALHALNCVRNGYLSPVFDIRYMASVVQMPLFAVCFLLAIREERTKDAALYGFGIAAALTVLFLIISRITNTGNVTYGVGMGYSGWVIDVNRNANSTNLVIFAALSTYLAIRSNKPWVLTLTALTITAVFLSNGTKGCYFSIFLIFLGYAAWLLAEKLVLKKPLQRGMLLILVLCCIFSTAVYPWTPRYRVEASQRESARGAQGEIEATLLEQGIDITDMSPQERFDNPAVKEVFIFYYWRYLGVKPDLIDRFGMDRVLMQYNMSTDVDMLIDSRVMERQYAAMVFQDSDFLTKIVGFEVSQMGYDGIYDLENDWHAVFYYYGYLGFVLYVGFVLYFLWRVIRQLRRDFMGSLKLENFALLLTLILILGLAHFSGATLRRPNVSIWLSLVLALIYFVTEAKTNEA